MSNPPVATIDANGITAPTLADVIDFFKSKYRNIYGQDVYLEDDSQDGQMLSLFAQAVHDANNMAVSVYNAFSPSTAQGVGLSRVVKINGMVRKIPSYSMCDVLLTGQAGVEIYEGEVAASDGSRWTLPREIVIPLSGEITVTAICTTPGAIVAGAGEIDTITTNVAGWQSVTNPAAATPGAPVENDALLRVRQGISTMIPSVGVFDGLHGALAALPGSTAMRLYENDGDGPDPVTGIPGHAIALVMKGGDAQLIADTMRAKKSPGVRTFGTTSAASYDAAGVPRTINFSRPRDASIAWRVELKALRGFQVSDKALIAAALVNWTNELGIGNDVLLTRAYGPASLPGTPSAERFQITALKMALAGAAPIVQDLAMDYDEMPGALIENVTFTVTT